MKFLYAPLISAAPDGGDFLLILRPEIPITIVGPSGSATYSGLVDTGSDNTILPLAIAQELGIPVQPAPGPPATVFSGSRVQLLIGEATLRLQHENETVEWKDTVCFFDFKSRGRDGHSRSQRLSGLLYGNI